MTQRPGIWVGGVVGSTLAHLGFAALLLWSIKPEAIDPQPSPQSELQLQAYRIPQSEAVPLEPKADAAAESDAQGEGVAEGAVPQSSAQRLDPQASWIKQSPPENTALTAAHDTSEQAKPLAAAPKALVSMAAPNKQVQATAATAAPLAHSQIQTANLVPVSQPDLVSVAAAPVATLQASAVLPPTPVVLSAATARPEAVSSPSPQSRPVPVAQPNSTPSLQRTPETTDLNAHPPAPIAAAQSEPEVPHIKAALAFSGEDAGQADPVSLTAFQSFMRPGETAAAGDRLRDGVAGVLAAVPCSRLQVMFDPDTATLNLRGHLPEAGLRAPVLAALQAQMGADIQVSDQMKILPRPQCGALAGISNVGLPQSTDQITNPRLIGADTHARVLTYSGGDRLFFDLTAPDYDAYVYVDYFDAGGAVVHLSPNEVVPLVLTPAQTRLRVGAKTPEDIGLQITVGPPYGQEIAVAFAASHPLYSGQRPISEEAAGYLEWLSTRVAEARIQYPDFKGEWVYFFVSTAAQ